MTDKRKRPLPKPPASPFGGKRRFGEEEESAPLVADEMARAMAEGKLEEFLKREMPDNEHARKLAMMMLGMTGMLPPGVHPSQSEATSSDSSAQEESPDKAPPGLSLEDVTEAARSGDVRGLMELLKKEHEKRSADPEKAETPSFSATEKETIEKLMGIASQNNLTLDWVILRALKRYIEEYRKTGLL